MRNSKYNELQEWFTRYLEDFNKEYVIKFDVNHDSDEHRDYSYEISSGEKKLLIQVEESDNEITTYSITGSTERLLGVTYMADVDLSDIKEDIKRDFDAVFGTGIKE